MKGTEKERMDEVPLSALSQALPAAVNAA